MNGTYGTTRPANINPDDAEVFYIYRPSRSEDSPEFPNFKKLKAEDVLKACTYSGENNSSISLLGMYTLRLPMNEFGKKGIYTIYIKPKEIEADIVSFSTLSAFPDVKGVVFRIGGDISSLADNGKLVGYRIENGEEYRLITSSNRCIPVPQNSNNAGESNVRYALNETGQFLFCTLTPLVSMPFLNETSESIGTVKLVNTKFNPVMLEVEMVEHDAETISTMLEGDQLRNLDTQVITTFNKDGGIYHQASYGNLVNPGRGMHYDFKIVKDEIFDYKEEEKFKDIKDNAGI
jgi:hypothetical protein